MTKNLILDLILAQKFDNIKKKKKKMTQPWENLLTEGWMDRRTDGLTARPEWFYRMLFH